MAAQWIALIRRAPYIMCKRSRRLTDHLFFQPRMHFWMHICVFRCIYAFFNFGFRLAEKCLRRKSGAIYYMSRFADARVFGAV